MEGYNVTIKYTSRDLTGKERVRIKDFSGAVQLDTAVTTDTPMVINYDFHAILDVHNEKSRDQKDYEKVVITDKGGTKYVTGSQSFITALEEVLEEMKGVDEDFGIEVYKLPSKNYQGKTFLTCTVI